MKQGFLLAGLFLSLSLTLHAQNFSSGSTGADGALDCSNASANNNCEVQIPESGILNYTTINIPLGKGLIFKSNSRNTPVILLAQGDVNISGVVNVGGRIYGVPGPGGFHGGRLRDGGQVGSNGFGPGGGVHGQGEERANGKWVGSLSLIPIIGGSGGASYGTTCNGGAGGGALVIASSTNITVSGLILADGQSGYTQGFSNCGPGVGSGGAIRLVANSINIAQISIDRLHLSACGSTNCISPGLIRLETPTGNVALASGSSSPAAVVSSINPIIVPSSPSSLTITSVGGYAVPSYAGSSFDTVDLLLPNQLQDPISVVVRANNIPVGTQVQVGFVSGSGQATSTPGTLSGTFENSTATATISGLNRTGVTYLLASATFDPPASAANFNPKGPDQVSKIRVEAAPGAKPKYVFLRGNGTVIETAKLSPQFLQQFAQ